MIILFLYEGLLLSLLYWRFCGTEEDDVRVMWRWLRNPCIALIAFLFVINIQEGIRNAFIFGALVFVIAETFSEGSLINKLCSCVFRSDNEGVIDE